MVENFTQIVIIDETRYVSCSISVAASFYDVWINYANQYNVIITSTIGNGLVFREIEIKFLIPEANLKEYSKNLYKTTEKGGVIKAMTLFAEALINPKENKENEKFENKNSDNKIG